MTAGVDENSGYPWPADKVERRPVATLVPYAGNARTHSEAQVAQIAGSIREWGWTNPVLVDEAGTIIAGHGRVLAAQRLGIGEVPVMVAAGWSEAQKKAHTIADNKLALNAGWDEELLALEFGDLSNLGFDLSLIGFSDEELAALMAEKGGGLTDPDDTPEPPVNPVTRPGDVWVLGKHRLRCGDATSADDVAALLDGVAPHLMVTDPPYGVYCDVIVRRWQAFTGNAAVLDGDGRTFAAIDEERFDPDDNSRRCFDEAIGAMREQRDSEAA